MITYSDNREIIVSCDKRSSGKVVIPEGVLVIESHAFEDCSEITEIVLPNTLQELRWAAFKGCTSLVSIDIPDSVIKISWECFSGCI